MGRTFLWLAGALVGLGAAACRPPPLPPGYVSTAPGLPRQVDTAVMAGLATIEGDPNSVFGGGGVQAEAYATPRLSIPAAVGGGASGPDEGFFASRLGLRWRTLRGVSLGGGLGPSMLLWDDGEEGLDTGLGGAFDLEISYGHRWDRFALSATARPAVVVGSLRDAGFYGIVEAAPALFVTPRFALTGHVIGGPWVDGGGVTAFIGGGLGLFVHL